MYQSRKRSEKRALHGLSNQDSRPDLLSGDQQECEGIPELNLQIHRLWALGLVAVITIKFKYSPHFTGRSRSLFFYNV